MVKENNKKNKKAASFSFLRKSAVCALVGATAVAGGLLAGCDDQGLINGPVGTKFYYGTEIPNIDDNPGKVGDFYIETDVGDVWQLGAEGWEKISNLKGPTGPKGDKGDVGDQGVSIVNVTIQPGFDGDGNVYMDYTFHYSNGTTTSERVYTAPVVYVGTEMTLEKAIEVVGQGGTVALKKDVELDKVVLIDKTLTIDLAGRKITNTQDIWNEQEGEWSLISVREGGNLTITDTGLPYNMNGPQNPDGEQNTMGTLMAKENDCYAVDVQEGGKLTINGGYYVGNISAVYVTEGEIVINDGTFDVKQLDARKGKEFMLNCLDANYSNGTAKITVNGGNFVDYNPAQNTAEGNDTNFVSEGYMVVSMPATNLDGTPIVGYTVVSGMEVLEALEYGYLAGCTITLASDIELPYTGLVINTEMTLDLNGYTISAPRDDVGDGVFHVVSGGRLTIEGDGVIDAECKSGWKMAVWADGGEVVINGGTFTNSTTEGTDNQYDLIYASNGGVVTINAGTFDCKTPRWTLNVKNSDKDFTFIYVYGGVFKNYDPSASITDENENNNPPTDFVVGDSTVVPSEEDANGDVWYTIITND